ncbi:MAG: TolC family protein [Pseudobdellovibrionaceae bacterium]
MKFNVALFALSFFSSVCTFAQPPSPNLSLSEAVDQAVKNNPSVLEIEEKIHQSEEKISSTWSLLAPTLSATATNNRQKDAVTSNVARFNGDPYNSYNSSIKLTQVLFQLGSLSAIDSAKKDRDISKLNAEIANRDLIKNVVQAYYLVVLNSRNIETLVRQQNLIKESLAVAQRRERTGRGQLLDTLQVKTQLSLLQGQISTAKNSLDVAIANLSNLLGNKAQTQFNIKNSIEAPSLNFIDKDVDLKSYRIPELIRDEVLSAQIDDQKRVLWGQNLPNVSLIGTYSFANYKQSDLYDNSSVSWLVGVQLTIPLFSGFSTVYQSQALTSQQIQYDLDRKSVENNVDLQQITNHKNIETARDSISTGEEALKLATASIKEAKKNYGLATIDYLQYITVQQSFVQAEQSLNSYKYNYITALSNYYAATGQDMKHLISILEKANQ